MESTYFYMFRLERFRVQILLLTTMSKGKVVMMELEAAQQVEREASIEAAAIVARSRAQKLEQHCTRSSHWRQTWSAWNAAPRRDVAKVPSDQTFEVASEHKVETQRRNTGQPGCRSAGQLGCKSAGQPNLYRAGQSNLHSAANPIYIAPTKSIVRAQVNPIVRAQANPIVRAPLLTLNSTLQGLGKRKRKYSIIFFGYFKKVPNIIVN